jgi:hypothetical protein
MEAVGSAGSHFHHFQTLPSQHGSSKTFTDLKIASPLPRFHEWGHYSLATNLTLGYYCRCMTDVNKAASLMGRKSAEARKKKWGKKAFVTKMREWGKLGGRPKGSGEKTTKGGKK